MAWCRFSWSFLQPGDHLDRVVPDAQLLAGPEPLVAVEDLVLGGDLDGQLGRPGAGCPP